MRFPTASSCHFIVERLSQSFSHVIWASFNFGLGDIFNPPADASVRKSRDPNSIRGGHGASNEYNCAAGWSSPVAREAHNLEVVSSNLAPATRMGGYEQFSTHV